MISYCRSYLVQLLTDTVKATPVYINPEDGSRYKGLTYSLIICGKESLQKQKERVVKQDELENQMRRYRYLIYKSTLPVYIDIIAKNLEQAEGFRQSFLTNLDDRILDPDGNSITIEVTECDVIQEESVLNPREGYQFTVVFYGGVYRDKTVDIITGQFVPNPVI